MAEIAVRSEVVGTVMRIAAAAGAQVAEGDELVILESMKMELPVLAPAGGVVSAILVAEGDQVGEGQVLARLTR
ncbi:MAG TPA: biotin/lipoyl-binding carrier protein [Stellaceae bacterium]|jgi:acetyl-CoA carboxylase biotin carboxyl carrier protein|nr:biotin/lipoyl-binding carrier protein [Stellaceae bacterium]